MANLALELGRGLITATSVSTAQAMYTNLVNKDAIITHIMMFNSHTSAVTVYLCKVDNTAGSPSTPAVTDEFFELSLDTKETLMLGPQDMKVILAGTGDTLNGYASVASKINYWVYGMKVADQS